MVLLNHRGLSTISRDGHQASPRSEHCGVHTGILVLSPHWPLCPDLRLVMESEAWAQAQYAQEPNILRSPRKAWGRQRAVQDLALTCSGLRSTWWGQKSCVHSIG